jgi:tRNA(His) 5'-end guanylyltransferase
MGQYMPRAFNGMMENPTSNRFEAAKKLIEAGGRKMILIYGMPAEGPRVMAIFEASTRLLRRRFSAWSSHLAALQRQAFAPTNARGLVQVRQKASQRRSAYKPPASECN